MASPVEIANIALAWLGANPIISFDDGTTEANLCKLLYPGLRDTLLADREWTFAVKRTELPQLASPPAWGYTKQYQLPEDILRVLSVSDNAVDAAPPHTIEWRREGQTIRCDSDRIYVRYLCRIEDSAEYSPHFVQALAARMAADMATPIVQSRELAAQMYDLYMAKILEAAAVDGLQGTSDVTRARQLHEARGRGAFVAGPYV